MNIFPQVAPLPREIFPAAIGGGHETFPLSIDRKRPKKGLPLEGSEECRGRSLVLEAGQESCLTTLEGEATLLEPRIISTKCLSIYKGWIGVDDAVARNDEAARRLPVPDQPWPEGRSVEPGAFSPSEVADIELAARAYLFGDSERVASYRDAIEAHAGCFEAAVYEAGEVVLAPGSKLKVSGLPAILRFERLEVQSFGQLALFAPCRAVIEHMVKTGPSSAANIN